MPEPSAASPLIAVVQKDAPVEAVAGAAARAVRHAQRQGIDLTVFDDVTVLIGSRRHLQDAALLGHYEGRGFGVGNHAGARVVLLAPSPGLLSRRPLRRLRSLHDRLVVDKVAAAANPGEIRVAV